MIYLDSAATAMQKPAAVGRAMAFALGHMASPGRGGHRPAMLAGDTAFRCRQEAAGLFRLDSPEQVVFTLNATHALNIAIKSLVRPGDTVLISGYEHNAVTRPLHAIPDVTVKVAAAPPFDQGALLGEFSRRMTPEVTTVVCTHVSNVFGYILPIEEIARLCRQRGKRLIVDASQSAGSLPVHMDVLQADFIAMPGHKGLCGPQGTGLLLCGGEAQPLLYGGTGSLSARQEMPDFLPDRLEAGTQNVCGAAGLLAGLEFVERKGTERIHAHEQGLAARMIDRLGGLPGVSIYRGRNQSGLFSLVVDGMDCETVAERLGQHGIAVRAGLHCAPLAHQSAGTADTGTVRFSFSAFNSADQVDRGSAVLARIVKDGKKAW